MVHKKLLQVYVTPEQEIQIRATAKRLGLSISSLFKLSVLSQINQEGSSQNE